MGGNAWDFHGRKRVGLAWTQTRGTDMGDIHIFTTCTMFFTNVPAPIPTFAGFRYV